MTNFSPEVERIFHEIADLNPGQRAEYFEKYEMAEDVRREVEELLAADVSTDHSLAELVGGQIGATLNQGRETEVGDRCGPYRLLKEIGRGGMGEVWLAERVDGLMKRQVALKLPYLGIQASEFVRRSHRERDILASLAHQGIARLYDAGLTEAGTPFLVLEFIEGVAIDRFCDERQLPVRDRLSLFIQVLDAVQYAHSHLIIHSDLKPSNILVSSEGEAKLLDFGIAKLIRSDNTAADPTLPSAAPLTPGYAAPEQIVGQRVTTACDVFSLGVILFELLSGQRPFAVKRNLAGVLEQQTVTERPSQAGLDEAKARARSSTPKRLTAALKGDLDNITLKAIQQDPEKRYATADAFKSDLHRYLAGEPVLARPESKWYRAKKFIGRHKVGVAAAASVTLAITVGFSVALWEAHIARREAQTSAAVQEFIQSIFHANSRDQPDPLKARQTTARQLLDIGAQQIDGGLKNAPAAKEKMLRILAELYLGLGLDDQAVALSLKQVAVVKVLYGANDPKVAAALCDLAASMEASRSVNEREAVLLEAKRILDSNHDFSSPARGELLRNLAKLYKGTDQQKALNYANQAVSFYRRTPPSLKLAEALYDQAVDYGLFTNYAKAEISAAESVSIAQRVGGEATAALPAFEELLAVLNLRLLRYDAAKENFELAFRSARDLNGDEHVDTIETEVGLGDFFTRISQYGEALRILKRALDACLKLRGPDDPFHTPQILLFYGAALKDSGQFEAGLAAISQAVENRRKNGPRTGLLGEALWWQGSVLADLGEYEKARLCLDKAAALSKTVGFKLRSEYVLARLKLAFDLKKPGEASAIIESSYGPLSDRAPLSLDLLGNLTARAQLALMMNDPATALRLATRLSGAIAASPNRKYLRLWEERAALAEGNAYLLQHRAFQALLPLQHAVQLDAEMYDSASAELIPSRVAVAAAYLKTGNHAESARLLALAESVHRVHPHLGERFEVPFRELRRNLRANAGNRRDILWQKQ